MNQKIIPIASVVVGLLAFFLTFQHLRGKYKELDELKLKIEQGARKIDVVVARQDIPRGMTIRRTDLAKKSVFEVSVRGHVVHTEDVDKILERKTIFAVKREEPIFWSDIEGGAGGAIGLADMIDGDKHMRAISLSVGGAAAVSGMVQPNDRVDVLGTFIFPAADVPGEMETVTLTVLQDVTILATGQRLAKHALAGGGPSRASGYSTVTLEVTPREAELLVFAEHTKGRLTLSLRHPGDVSYESDLPDINFEHLQKRLKDYNLYRQKDIRHKRNL